MAYSVRTDRICKSGMPFGAPRLCDAKDEADAFTSAANEVGGSERGGPRIATVKDGAGRFPFTYSGPANAARG